MDSYASRDYIIPRTYTSSEALKWTMTSSPPVPLRSNTNFSCYVKPPFATGFDEVNKQKRIAVPKLRQQYSKYNPPKPASPYPPTQPRFHLYNMAKENQFQRPSSYSTRKFSWPSYNSLNDPHMQEYFLKRFGRCKTDITIRKSSMNRSQSTGSTTSRLSQNHLRRSRSQMQSNTSVFYKVSVSTGDKKNCGTAAKIFLTVNGTYGKINRTQLIKKKSKKSKTTSSPFYFSKDSTNVFKINSHDIGDIKSIFIENSGTKKQDAWFLDTVEISNSTKKKSWTFLCYQWLSLYHSDGHSERKLFPHKLVKTDYEVVTVTGDVVGAGTNANVFITLFGKQGISQKLHLKSKKLCFQRNQSDSFRVKTNRIDPLVKIRIEHDNTGYCPGWFLERIVVTDIKGSKIPYYFPCGKWLAKDEEDGNISRDIFGSSNHLSKTKDNIYKVTVFTGNVKGAGTDACVYITLFGELSDSGECRLRSAKNNFERGKVDEFLVKCPCLGPLKSIRIGHDNSGFGAGWFLDKENDDQSVVSVLKAILIG